MRLIRRFHADISGATAVEYGLLAVLISVALLGGFGALSGNLQNTLTTVDNSMVAAGKK